MFTRHGFTSDFDSSGVDYKYRGGIRERHLDGANRLHLDAELLAQLSADGGRYIFTPFKLTSGELPETAMPFTGRPLSDEKATSALNYCGHHLY